jgi:hypothetical protein
VIKPGQKKSRAEALLVTRMSLARLVEFLFRAAAKNRAQDLLFSQDLDRTPEPV